jgi:thioredoxin-like negative regulator of GroEL
MTGPATLSKFRDFLAGKPVVIAYFSTEQCNVCKVLRPKVEQLTNQYDAVDFIYINTEEKPEIAGQYTVFSVPTIIIFTEGRESRRLSRSFSIDEIKDYLERLLQLLS